MKQSKGKYFVDWLKSFVFGNPEYNLVWKDYIKQAEEDGYDVAVFILPKQNGKELVVMIEKLINDKTN